LNENKLSGAELKNLTKYEQLRTLKFAGNVVKEFSDLEVLVRSYSHLSQVIFIYRRNFLSLQT